MAQVFLSAYTDEDIVSSTGVTREVFVSVYDKYCGFDTPINR